MHLVAGLPPDLLGSLSTPAGPLAAIGGCLLLKGMEEEKRWKRIGRELRDVEGRLASHSIFRPYSTAHNTYLLH